MTTIYGTALNASGQPLWGRRVAASLSQGAVNSGDIVSHGSGTFTDRDGYWELELIPNSSYAQPDTYYVIRQFGVKFFIEVPDSETPVAATSVLISTPENPLSPDTYVNDIEGQYGSISAAELQAIVGTGGGEGGGGAVSSVDGRTGVVTLNDRYASLTHNHDGVYAPAAHTHDYAATNHNHTGVYSPVSHDHDADYVQIGSETVKSVDGLTGNVSLSAVYAAIDHTHEGGGGGEVTSVDGQTGVVDLSGVYSAITHDHDADYSPLGHTHDYPVDSVDGRTGAVTLDDLYSGVSHNHDADYADIAHNHDTDYVQIGQETVTSVNGMTGDVVVAGGGESAVVSVDGRDGVVTLDDLYAPLAHDHDADYSAIGHSHDYPVDSVDGRTGTVTLNDLYAAAVHNHDLAYAPLSHNHDADYADIAHTHTGVYATASHNHDTAYAALNHDHDSDYSAIGHTHDYPVDSVDGRTGAVTLTDLYASAGHNHNGVYATASHNHDSAYAAISHTHNITECFTFSHQGTLTTGAGTSRKYLQYAGDVVAVRISVGTAPTGASVTVDVNKNGTTIFTTQSNRPSIAASSNTGSTTTINSASFTAGQYLTVDIDGVGSTVAGSDLVVDVYYQRSQ